MKPDNLYKFLDLPSVPEDLIKHISIENTGDLIRDYKGWDHTRNGKIIKSSDNPFFNASNDLKNWITTNIISEYNDIGIRFAFGNAEVKTAGVHTDETRQYVLQYNLDHADGELCFWKEAGYDVVRDGRYRVSTYENLELLDTVFIPNYTWMILNARVLHSVENLTRTRINIQVSLNHNPWNNLNPCK